MDIQVQLEKSSNILRKLIITVPVTTIRNRFERQLLTTQKKAKMDGFRAGHVPLPLVKKLYGHEVRRQVLNDLMDESFTHAIQSHKLNPIGQPRIDTKDENPFLISEDQDLKFTALVDVLPEIEPKNYKGVSLKRNSVEVNDQEIEQFKNHFLNQHAQLVSYPNESQEAKKGDFVDLEFEGGLLSDKGFERKDNMSGSRLVEIGSQSLIEGFEDNLIGLKKGDSKTFALEFPKDYFDAEMRGASSQFSVKIHEVKYKDLPKFDDEFAKTLGYEDLADFSTKTKSGLLSQKTEEEDNRLKNELLQKVIEANKLEIPESLITAQTHELTQEFARNLKGQGFTDPMIKEAAEKEAGNLKIRAHNQVAAGLLLDAISKIESLSVSEEDVDQEIKKMITQMKKEEARIKEFYKKKSNRQNLEFRMREEKTLKFLMDQAKIK
jgi:trigger factor